MLNLLRRSYRSFPRKFLVFQRDLQYRRDRLRPRYEFSFWSIFMKKRDTIVFRKVSAEWEWIPVIGYIEALGVALRPLLISKARYTNTTWISYRLLRLKTGSSGLLLAGRRPINTCTLGVVNHYFRALNAPKRRETEASTSWRIQILPYG